MSLAKRADFNVERSSTILDLYLQFFEPEPNTGCWIWIGIRSKKHGYGTFALGSVWLLAWKKVAYIRQNVVSRGDMARIARKYDVAASAVWAVVRGKTWKRT